MDQARFFEELSELPIIAYRVSRSVSQGKSLDTHRCVSGMQMHALFILYKTGRHNMTELANLLIVTRQQLTKLIDSLVEKGLVERGDDPKNRRHVMVGLSEQGRLLVEEAINNHFQMMSAFFSTLNDGDAERFMNALATIKEIFTKIA